MSILDAQTGLAYLAAVIDSDIAVTAARKISPVQIYAAGHRDGVEQTLHRMRREVQHVQALVDAIARGSCVPLLPAPRP